MADAGDARSPGLKPRSARVPRAPGRFVVALVLLGGVGCARVGSGDAGAGAGPAAPPEPVVEAGGESPGREAQASTLFRRAGEAYAAEDYAQAYRLAAGVVEGYPRARVSGRALRLAARAALRAGMTREADAAAERYASLLPRGDDRIVWARLLQSQALEARGDGQGRLDRLLRAGGPYSGAAAEDLARAIRDAAGNLSLDELEPLIARLDDATPGAPAVLARYAWLLAAAGRDDDAHAAATRALATGAQGPDSLLAEGVLDPASGLAPPLPTRRVTVGAVLPLTGSPAMRDFAHDILDGVEVAAEAHSAPALQIRVDAKDDQGDIAFTGRAVRDIESAGAVAAVGFLEALTVQQAAAAREDGLPLISPTARSGGEGAEAVFVMDGADPAAAALVARYAADHGYARVALIHSRAPSSQQEADAFTAEATALSLPVAGRFAYEAGATFFQEQIRGALEVLRLQEIRALGLGEEDTLHVEELDPVALVLPIPPEDVEFLAPQVTFFGLDTLGIDILGTAGWTDPQVLAAVDPRHTTGVVATAPVAAGPGSAGYRRFREAYEAHFQRSLVSPVPALGYDAALLAITAVERGARGPAEVARALEGIRDLEGATGILNVRDGRVLRRQELVRIVNGASVPLTLR